MLLDRYISQAHKPADKGRLLAVLKTVSWRIVGTLDTIVTSYLLTGTLEVACKVDAVEQLIHSWSCRCESKSLYPRRHPLQLDEQQNPLLQPTVQPAAQQAVQPPTQPAVQPTVQPAVQQAH